MICLIRRGDHGAVRFADPKGSAPRVREVCYTLGNGGNRESRIVLNGFVVSCKPMENSRPEVASVRRGRNQW